MICTMKVKLDESEFQWDKGNRDKSRQKHGVTPDEAESVFVDENSVVIPDMPHSKSEVRFVIVGKSNLGRDLYIAFTRRKDKVRVISARQMHREEVEKYDKIKKSS